MVLKSLTAYAAFAAAMIVSPNARAQASSSPPGFGFALECGRCGSLGAADQGAIWRFSEYPIVVAVTPGSAAARSGMKEGDTLVAIDGFSLVSEAGSKRFASVRSGDRVTFTVGREQKRAEVVVSQVPARSVAPVGDNCMTNSSSRGSTNSVVRDNEKTIEWRNAGCSVELTTRGEYTLRSDLSDVETLTRGSSFMIDLHDGNHRRELSIRNDRGSITHEWRIDGKETAWTDDSRRWLGSLLMDLDRRTAFAIDVRFPELLRQGGTSGVLEEITRMTGDLAKAQYYHRLSDSAPLGLAEVKRVLAQLDRDPMSDFARTRVLSSLQKQPAMSDPSLTTDLIRSASRLDGVSRSRALSGITQRGPLSVEATSLLVESLTSRDAGFASTQILENLIRSSEFPVSLLDEVIAASKRLEPEMIRARILEAIGTTHKLEGTTRTAYIEAVRGLQVRMLRDRLLATIVDKEPQ